MFGFYHRLINKSSFWSDSFIRWTSFCAIALIAITVCITLHAFLHDTHSLVLHFADGKPDLFGSRVDVFLMLAIPLVLIYINMALMRVLYTRVRPYAYMLAGFNVFFAVLILIAFGVMISVN